MSGPAKRIHQRYACRIQVKAVIPGVRERIVFAELLDLGQGGALVSVKAILNGPVIELIVPMDGTEQRFKARIMRTIGRDSHDARFTHYGVRWELHMGNETHLKRLLDMVRTGKMGSPTKGGDNGLSRDYWSL
jgi:hypothetical protein